MSPGHQSSAGQHPKPQAFFSEHYSYQVNRGVLFPAQVSFGCWGLSVASRYKHEGLSALPPSESLFSSSGAVSANKTTVWIIVTFIRLLLTISVHKQLSDHFLDLCNDPSRKKKKSIFFSHFCKMLTVCRYGERFPWVISIMGRHSHEQQPRKWKHHKNGDAPLMGCGYWEVQTGNPCLQYKKS